MLEHLLFFLPVLSLGYVSQYQSEFISFLIFPFDQQNFITGNLENLFCK